MQKTIKIDFRDLPRHSNVPVFSYCRKLIKQGEDPSTRLEVYYNKDEPDVIIPSIGWAAQVSVHETIEEGPYFKKYREMSFKGIPLP